jgi:hypothetical protein
LLKQKSEEILTGLAWIVCPSINHSSVAMPHHLTSSPWQRIQGFSPGISTSREKPIGISKTGDSYYSIYKHFGKYLRWWWYTAFHLKQLVLFQKSKILWKYQTLEYRNYILSSLGVNLVCWSVVWPIDLCWLLKILNE